MDSNIAAALIGATATVAAALITTIYVRRGNQEAASDDSAPSAGVPAGSMDLDGILERLERYRQRATFGAVAGLLGREPWTLFDGYPRTPRTSWVVSKDTNKPTGQSGRATHPDLLKNPNVIRSDAELRSWLASHP